MSNVNPTTNRTAVTRPQAPSPQAADPTTDDPTQQVEAQSQAPADDASATGSSQTDATTTGHKSRGLLGGIADVFIGGGQALGDMVKGVFTVITHPIQTVKGLGYVVTHPASLVNAFVEPYKQAIAEGRPGLAIGRGIVEIGSLFVGPGDIAGAFKGAKGILTGSKGAAEAGQVTAKAGALGARGAELSTKLTGQAAAATEKAAALSAVGATAEAAKLNQFARIMQKSATLAATGTDEGVMKAMRYATMAANAQTVKLAGAAGTTTMSMAQLVDHSNALLMAAADGTKAAGAAVEGAVKAGASGATKAGKAASTASKAAKAVELASAYDLPVKLTKGASQVVKDLGLSTKEANTVLQAADAIFKEQRIGGATQKVALDAAKAAMAEKLGVAATDRSLDILANTLKPATKTLLNNAKTVAAEFERTNYVTRPLVNGAKAIGRPVDRGIVAVNHAGQKVAASAAEASQRVATAVSKIGDLQIREIPHVIGELATYPFRVTYQAVSKAGTVLRDGLEAIGEMPIRRIWEAPIEGVSRAIAGGAEFAGRLPNMTLGELAAAPFSSGLLRPAVAASVMGRLNGTQNMPADDDAIAKKYHILGTPENVKAFKDEIATYQTDAIGPDSGSTEQVKQVQTILQKLGYDVKPTGEFDEATANAIIDFKTQHGITQGYQLDDGSPAVNEYVDQATAKAMVAELKGGTVDPASVPKVTEQELQGKLESLSKAFTALRGAKTNADKAKAKQALEATAKDAIGALTAFALANPDAKADCQAQMQEIGKALSELGYSDSDISGLVKAAQADLKKKLAATSTSGKPDAAAGASGDVSGDQVSQSLDALAASLDALRGAKTDADKAAAQKDVEVKSLQAVHDLTAYGLTHPDAKQDVEDQLSEIASALKEQGYSDDDIRALVKQGQADVAPAKPSTSETSAGDGPVPGTIASYEFNMQDVQDAMAALKSAKDPKEIAAAQRLLLAGFKGAVSDFNQMVSTLPADQAAKVQNQLQQLGTALTQLGFSRDQIANILSASRPATGASTASTKPATQADAPSDGSYTVKGGDSLSRIAQATLGDANRWREIYDANKAVIGMNPNMILPGTKLTIPGAKAATPTPAPAQPAAPTQPAAPAQPQAQAEPQAPAADSGAPELSDAQLKQIVKDKGLQDDLANAKAFVDEISAYRASGAIGPDAGSPAVVRNLQTLLVRLGYKVDASGSFDDATANAIIDFKMKQGLHQTYRLADGTWAVNEYVGEDTARALVDEVKKQQAKAA